MASCGKCLSQAPGPGLTSERKFRNGKLVSGKLKLPLVLPVVRIEWHSRKSEFGIIQWQVGSLCTGRSQGISMNIRPLSPKACLLWVLRWIGGLFNTSCKVTNGSLMAWSMIRVWFFFFPHWPYFPWRFWICGYLFQTSVLLHTGFMR